MNKWMNKWIDTIIFLSKIAAQKLVYTATAFVDRLDNDHDQVNIAAGIQISIWLKWFSVLQYTSIIIASPKKFAFFSVYWSTSDFCEFKFRGFHLNFWPIPRCGFPAAARRKNTSDTWSHRSGCDLPLLVVTFFEIYYLIYGDCHLSQSINYKHMYIYIYRLIYTFIWL